MKRSLVSRADKDMGHPSRRVITKQLDQLVQQQDDEYNNEGIISVYCAILGAIVLGTSISHERSRVTKALTTFFLYSHSQVCSCTW